MILLLILATLAHSADTCNVRQAISQSVILEARLQQSVSSERRWANTWGTVWGVTTAAQLAIMPVIKDDDTKTDLVFGAASSALGLIPTFIMPPLILRERSRIDAATALTDPCERNQLLQELVTEDLDDKRLRRGVFAHAGNVAVNLALGAILAYGIGHKQSGYITGLSGIPVGIFMLMTQPKPYDADVVTELSHVPRVIPYLSVQGAFGAMLALEF